jgi:hypothetical protein
MFERGEMRELTVEEVDLVCGSDGNTATLAAVATTIGVGIAIAAAPVEIPIVIAAGIICGCYIASTL